MSTLLRKVERVRLIPGTPGSPGVPAGSYCLPAPPEGLYYLDCVLEGQFRNPNAARLTARENLFWLPGCVYRETTAPGAVCAGPFDQPIEGSIANGSGVYYVCQPSSGGVLWWRVLDEFGRRERVVPPPSPPPPRRTLVPFSPPPPVQEPVLPPGTRSLGGGCYAFDGIAAVPAQPARVTSEAVQAWDSGGHSIVELPRSCRLVFTVPDAVGAACGLTPASTRAAVDVERITHGFIVSRNNGVPSVRVIERGVVRTPFIATAIGTELQVARRGTSVYYSVAGEQVYASTSPSEGPVKVASSLFAPGDTIG